MGGPEMCFLSKAKKIGPLDRTDRLSGGPRTRHGHAILALLQVAGSFKICRASPGRFRKILSSKQKCRDPRANVDDM